MFRKLLPYLNHLMLVSTTVGSYTAYYQGKLLEISPETFEMELYTQEGEPEGRIIELTPNITSVQLENRELMELSLKIKYNQSADDPDYAAAAPEL